jgi:hypothetical protein
MQMGTKYNVSSCVRQAIILQPLESNTDRLCCLVVGVPGYGPRRPWFDSRHYQIFWEAVDLEWGAILLKISGSGLENWD